MEVIRFSVYAPKIKQIVVYDYYLTGNIKAINFNDNANGGFIATAIDEAPIRINYIPGKIPAEFAGMIEAGCLVKDISTMDFSFDKFWQVYAYKRGNIPRCKKLWEKMSGHEKVLAIGFINKLRATYDREKKDMPYPETYLSQKRWENEL
jgi:hypothetical protein